MELITTFYFCNAIRSLFSFFYCCSKFPKTDYTYSRVSPHRRELAPGVIAMPNMSRRSLNTVRQNSWPESESSSGTSISVSKHDVTKSRWIDQSSSGRIIIFCLLPSLSHTRTFLINTFHFYCIIEKISITCLCVLNTS